MLTGALAVAIASLSQFTPPPPAPRMQTSAQPAVFDALEPVGPEDINLRGWLGARVMANARWLAEVDPEPMLAGYRHKPGSHPWIGEHIGKWMHAATLAWANASEPELKARLRKRLDYAAAELIKAQEPDGYLGTYVPEQRFGLFPGADWDVWSHKYCLIGLLTYSEYTGDAAVLAASKRAADLLIRTFAPAPDGAGKSIISAGTHMGMAATSVLEPMVLLYRANGEKRYLDFAEHIVRSYDEPGGPGIVASLLSHEQVHKTANGKAYEMLSNLVGLCELYRFTGNRQHFDAARNGWEDIVRNQLYITGTASHHEHFHEPHELPNEMSANVGETCVTVTWIQLCFQLLRLTGEAKYGDEIERSMYNHLAAAQHPEGKSWCYYTALEGSKPYTSDTCCCLSSGPRGMAMAPGMMLLKGLHDGRDALFVNLFEPAEATVTFRDRPYRVSVQTEFPRSAGFRLTIAAPEAPFAVLVRAPAWSRPLRVPPGSVHGRGPEAVMTDGWAIARVTEPRSGAEAGLVFTLRGDLVAGADANRGKAAATWGPFILGYDEAVNEDGPPAKAVWLTQPVSGLEDQAPFRFVTPAQCPPLADARPIRLVPLADAGASGGRYRVWLGAPGTYDPSRFSLLFGARESRSAEGNVSGSINDGDDSTFVVTFDGHPQQEAWFAVTGRKSVEVRRLVFVHGRTFHDGGWFDTSGGSPRIEVQDDTGGTWRRIGQVDSYPRTTALEAAGLKGGERFEFKFEVPIRAVAVRVIGTPACGDSAAQNFASCAELGVFAE